MIATADEQTTRKIVSLSCGKPQILSADALLFRPASLLGRIISGCGRSEYSHIGMARRHNGCLWCIESVWPRVRQAWLDDLVRRWPGRIDWYAAPSVEWLAGGKYFDRAAAAGAMLSLVGRPYGLRDLAAVALRHIPVIRALVPVLTGDVDPTDGPPSPFCSESWSWAMRHGGIDPVPRLADELTEPGDCARSLCLEFGATLVP
jgi:hypothetical protein